MAAFEAELKETRDIAVEARTEGRAHYVNCIEHNRRVEDLLTQGRTVRDEQHKQGQEAIERLEGRMEQNTERLHARISSLSGRVNAIIITTLATIVMASGGALYAILAHKLGL